MTDVKVVAYADIMYFFRSDTWEEVTNIVGEQTKKVIFWLQKSGMVLNASKTGAAYFALRELSNPRIL